MKVVKQKSQEQKQQEKEEKSNWDAWLRWCWEENALPKGVTMGKTLKTSAEGRKCMFPQCKSILSIYNHEDYCHVHRDQMSHEQKLKDLTHPYAQTVTM